uniref:Golgin A2 n=1 Tax=Callorhinchus milii TaxID=7868 RepID=A0A4W3GGX3_CALMI
MADESRQAKLAAAKKKLKEFQQKKSPVPVGGTKKKRRTKEDSRSETPTNDYDQDISDMPLQNILKVLVADRSKSNGVTLPSLDRLKACLENDADRHRSSQRVDEAELHFNTYNSNLPNKEGVTQHIDQTVQNEALSQKFYQETHEAQSEESREVSSTESLRQLSAQLNGLVTQNSYINGESTTATASPKELEKQKNQELIDRLDKEKKDSEQKCTKDQASMREQLQVHIQTIGILVSEKSELQSALGHTQQAARLKAGEAEELNTRLQSTRQRVAELERTLSSISSQQKQSDKVNAHLLQSCCWGWGWCGGELCLILSHGDFFFLQVSKELEKERENLKVELYRLNKMSDELKQQNSELSEQLHSRVSENGSMKSKIEDLHKKLEMAELMIQQFTNQSGLPGGSQQLQTALNEKAHLEAQMIQLSESLQKLRAERDQYAQKLQEEGSIWQEKIHQLAAQITVLSEEKECNQNHIRELETSYTELQTRSAQQCEVHESQTAPQPEGPTEHELALQADIHRLEQAKEELYTQYRAQVGDNEQLSRLNQEQEERLQELERTVQRYNDDTVDRHQLLENMQSDKVTISRALTQNRELKEQLAELQNGFVKLTNENMELTSALQSEQHVKKEVARRIGQLQEDLAELKEKLDLKSLEAQGLLEQRDQFYAHLQQYTAAYQQLISEREELQKQYLLQTQLMDRLQHEEVQGKVHIEVHQKDLQVTKRQIEELNKENETLKAQISTLTTELNGISPQLRMQGDGVESYGGLPEGIQKKPIIIPEDFESKEEMTAFLKSAISQLEDERDELTQQFLEQKGQHQALLQQMSALRSNQEQPRGTVNSTDTIPTEVHEALKAAMDKLQVRFTNLMQEKVDLKDRVEELEHHCIQLSGETDTIGEYIALYQSQRAILKQRHTEKEEYISRLAQDKEEMKMKLSELQELVMRLVGERNELYNKYVGATQQAPHSAAAEVRQHLPEGPMELNAVNTEDLQDVSLADERETQAVSSRAAHPSETTPPMGLPSEDHTAQQIMQLLQEIQNPQAKQSPFLSYSPCIPFFYRADEHDEVRILVV